ncbi:MAG TPA: hypothetical protein VMV86_00085 [Methanosarcinales archaeon]|nr:hypothetical protein [Methanosarcinales archaeon]
MVTNLNIHANVTANIIARATAPADYIQLDLANDKLIWSAGSTAVIDGADTPTSNELDEAATIITTSPVEIAYLFLLDFSDTGVELKEIDNAGSGNFQHVLNLSFDGATTTEPTLEAWDDNTHSSANLNVLGSGTPANSMIKAVLTTAGVPGAGWLGTPIAGAALPNVLQLNAGAGALVGATEIYINLKVDVPANHPNPFSETPVLTCRYTYI